MAQQVTNTDGSTAEPEKAAAIQTVKSSIKKFDLKAKEIFKRKKGRPRKNPVV